MMTKKLYTLFLGVLFIGVAGSAQDPTRSYSPEQLAVWLGQFPQADTNGDGTLTETEARAYQQKMRGKTERRFPSEQLPGLLKRYPQADANGDGVLTESEAQAYYAMVRGASATPDNPPVVVPAPTAVDVSYGPHARNVLDVWQAKSARPTPLVIFIHGGGFTSGDKSQARKEKLVQQCLDAGVSFASISYRYRTDTPIQDVLRDCARALQFLRSRAAEWNIDKARIASYGSSAGAGTSLWLAFHDDLADPSNADPVLRESTRLVCAGAMSPQFTYDLLKWAEVFGPEMFARYGARDAAPHTYGLRANEELIGPIGREIRSDCDMIALITKDDVPVFLSTGQPGGEVTDRSHYLHYPRHSQLLYERCRVVGVPVVLSLPAMGIAPLSGEPTDLRSFLFKHLGVIPRPEPTNT